MSIQKEQLKKIADAVRIEITDEKADQYVEEINHLIKHADRMSELNTDEVKPTTHGIVLGNVLRQDEPIKSLSQEKALKNAPDKQDGHFKVPSIME